MDKTRIASKGSKILYKVSYPQYDLWEVHDADKTWSLKFGRYSKPIEVYISFTTAMEMLNQ